MKIQHAAAFAAATAILALGTAFAAGISQLGALEAVDQAWVKGFNAGDADAVAALYDEKAVLMPPNVPAVQGRAAIRDFLAKEMAGAKKAGLVLALDAKPAGGASGAMGWESGSYTVRDKSGTLVEAGKYLSVSAKKGGKWLYVRDTWNADGAPPPAAAATGAAPKK